MPIIIHRDHQPQGWGCHLKYLSENAVLGIEARRSEMNLSSRNCLVPSCRVYVLYYATFSLFGVVSASRNHVH